MTVLRVALAQLNPTVGDLDGNVAKILHTYDLAETAGCDIVAFPELSVTGYPPEDLVLKPAFHDACRRACETRWTQPPTARARAASSHRRCSDPPWLKAP